MRMAFGFVGLLISVAILLVIWTASTSQVATSSKPAREVAQRVAGVESSGLGGRASDWVTLTDYTRDGRLVGMTVSQVTPGSSMQMHFGLQSGDRIVKVGPQTVRDIGDADMARALIAESYQRGWSLEVARGSQTLELPQKAAVTLPPTPAPQPMSNAATPAPANSAQPAAAPAAGAAPAEKRSPMQRQLDLIRGAGERED
jgi:hypothetical protein